MKRWHWIWWATFIFFLISHGSVAMSTHWYRIFITMSVSWRFLRMKMAAIVNKAPPVMSMLMLLSLLNRMLACLLDLLPVLSLELLVMMQFVRSWEDVLTIALVGRVVNVVCFNNPTLGVMLELGLDHFIVYLAPFAFKNMIIFDFQYLLLNHQYFILCQIILLWSHQQFAQFHEKMCILLVNFILRIKFHMLFNVHHFFVRNEIEI